MAQALHGPAAAPAFIGGARKTGRTFDPRSLSPVPEPVARWLTHALTPGAELTEGARIRQRGRVRFGLLWLPFRGELYVAPHRALAWRARVGRGPLKLVGADVYYDGTGSMAWDLLGVIPCVRATDEDAVRSLRGHLAVLSLWAPWALLTPSVTWSVGGPDEATARWTIDDQVVSLEIGVGPAGELREARTQRWGNPDGAGYRLLPYSVVVDREHTFGAVTVPARVRAGWWFSNGAFQRGASMQVLVDALTP